MAKFLRNSSRLGRGLSSLLSVEDFQPVEREIPPPPPAPPTIAEAPANAPAPLGTAVGHAVTPPEAPSAGGGSLISLPVASILPNPHQPRRKMDQTSLAELAQSLKTAGLIQPVIVRQVGERYELIAGERRWRAAQLAGLTSLPVIVKEVTEDSQAEMALIENIQRENLNPIDRALAYRSLLTQLGVTQAELAVRLGEDRSGIANHLRLLDLCEAVQNLVVDARLSLGHAKLLAGVPDILEQTRLATLVVAQDLSVRKLEQLLKDPSHAPPPSAKATAAPSAHVQNLEKSMSRQLGMRVQIRSSPHKKTKGRLVLHYATLDQFDDLLSRLGVKTEE